MAKKTRSRQDDDPLARTREAPAALPRISLLSAGEGIIREKGFARATVEEISARAGVSTDVFHAHFTGKGALLRALCDRWIEQMSQITEDATRSGIWATSTGPEVVDIAARSAIDAIFEHAHVVRAVLAHGATDPALRGCLKKIGTLLAKRVAKVLKENKRKEDAHIAERHVSFCLLTAIALAHHAILVGAESTGTPFDKDELSSEVSAMIAAYLDGLGSSKPTITGARKVPSRGNIRAATRV